MSIDENCVVSVIKAGRVIYTESVAKGYFIPSNTIDQLANLVAGNLMSGRGMPYADLFPYQVKVVLESGKEYIYNAKLELATDKEFWETPNFSKGGES